VGALIAMTGAGGFLGRHLTAALGARGFEVENIPRETRRSAEAMRAWLASRRPAALVHTAGIVDVRYCQAHPLEAFQAHVMDTAAMLEAIRHERPELPLAYIATDKSFGEQQDCGLDTPYRPVYPYDASKACEDLLVESYRATYGLKLSLLRFPNFYGEGDVHAERLIPSVCLAALGGHELTIRTRLDGSWRQYIYVKDAADIVRRILVDSLEGRPVAGRSHFGPPAVKSVGDVIADVEAILGTRIRVQVLNQPGESSTITLKDENALGYRYTDWLTGLAATVESYRGASA